MEQPKTNRILWVIVSIWAMMVLIDSGTLLAWLFRPLLEEIRVK